MSADESLSQFISERRNFEVKYTPEGAPVITEYRPPSRASMPKEIRKLVRRRTRRRIPRSVLLTLEEACKLLINKRTSFRVIFGANDVIIYLDLDHFIHIYPNKISIAGYNSLKEEPLASLRQVLEKHAPVKLLKPVR